MRYEIIPGPAPLIRLRCACGYAVEIPVGLLDPGHLIQCPGCQGYFRLPGERIEDGDYLES